MASRNWTLEERLTALMGLPWSVRVDRDETDGSWAAQVAEIPDAIATGRSMKELAQDLWEAIAASLEVRLEHGDPIPLPSGRSLPWEVDEPSRVKFVELQLVQPSGPLIIKSNATVAA